MTSFGRSPRAWPAAVRNFGARWTVTVLAACAAPVDQLPPAAASGPTGTSAATVVGPTRLERALVAALDADDAQIRSDALRALAWIGTRDHVAAVARCLDAADPEERAAALRTLGQIADNDPTARAAVTAHLRRGLRDPARECVREALQSFSALAPRDWDEVEAFLSSNDWELRLAALNAMLWHDRPVHPADLGAALRDFAGTAAARRLQATLQKLSDPAQRPLLEPMLGDADGHLRHLAQEAGTRLDAIVAGAADPRPTSQQKRDRFHAENRAAEQRVAVLPWREIAADELVATLRNERLVLFAEIHDDGGPLRAAQQRVLRAMAGGRADLLVLGYEPSVASAQRSVIDLAAELGIETRSMEHDWHELLATEGYAERDDQTAAAINACLRERPDRRMLVIRGESHCAPGGYLCRQLETPPVIVLSVRFPPLRALGEQPTVTDRTFRIGDDGRLFFWGCAEVLQPDLLQWIAARR